MDPRLPTDPVVFRRHADDAQVRSKIEFNNTNILLGNYLHQLHQNGLFFRRRFHRLVQQRQRLCLMCVRIFPSRTTTKLSRFCASLTFLTSYGNVTHLLELLLVCARKLTVFEWMAPTPWTGLVMTFI